MSESRSHVLAGVLTFFLVLTAAVIFDVIGTVFFAVTVAYLLAPVHDRIVGRGFNPKAVAALTTFAAALAGLVPVVVIGYLVYQRRNSLLDLVRELPEEFTVEFAGVVYALPLETVRTHAIALLQGFLADLATLVPVLALKFGLFALVVFGLQVRRRDAAAAVLAAVPDHYHDVLARLDQRTRRTLYAIYVLQVLTAIGTFFFALPVFVALGYDYAVTLSFVAGILQFLPIIGPSVLVVALAAYQLSVGALGAAVVVLVVGLVAIGGLPDLLIRPRFADEAAQLPGTLYYTGFLGGLLTVGAVGVVAGPLLVALLVEAAEMLAAEHTS